MKISEAIEILRQMDPNDEVKLEFDRFQFSNTRKKYHQETYSTGGRGGDDHPCGGSYETQAERFGY